MPRVLLLPLAVVVACRGPVDAPTPDLPVESSETAARATGDTAGSSPGDTAALQLSLRLSGSGYDEVMSSPGARAWFVVIAAPNPAPIPGSLRDVVVPEDGTVDEEWPDLLQRGMSYGLAWYIDGDGDGACSGRFPPDPAWTVHIPPVQEDVHVVYDADHGFELLACSLFPPP